MLLVLDDTIQPQSEALWEKAPAEMLMCFGSKGHQCYFTHAQTRHNRLRDGYTAFAYKVAPSV